MPDERQCGLCAKRYVPHEVSHIVPKFVYKWLKSTSTTKVMRFGPEMNRRTQDGIKDHFLCEACEDLFGKCEATFATEVFHPFTKDNNFITKYGGFMMRFAVSVSWRVLAYSKEKERLQHFRGRHAEAVDSTLKIWSDYLLNRRDDIATHEMHLLPMAGIVEHSFSDVPENINRYLRRTVEIDVVVSDGAAFTYTKLGPLMFIGLIAYPDVSQWEGTKILPNGEFPPRDFSASSRFKDYIFGRCKRLAELESEISKLQLEKIAASYEQNMDRLEQSDTYKALLMDLELAKKFKT